MDGGAAHEVSELCARLQRDAGARAVLVVGGEGELLGHSGTAGSLGDAVLDAVGDLTVDLLSRRRAPESGDADDLVAEVGAVHICGAAIGGKATLLVVFDSASRLELVRQRMKRARELILRTLDLR